MDRTEVEQEVIRILRVSALKGSNREISLNESPGPLGIGLDSLSLLEFIIALENNFDVSFSDDFMTGRGQLVLGDFVEVIMASEPPQPVVAQKLKQVPADEDRGYKAKAAAIIHEQGWLKGLVTIGARLVAKAGRFVYEREEFSIFACPLHQSQAFEYPASIDVDFHTAKRPGDLTTLDGFWKPRIAKEKMRIIAKRMKDGYVCLTTCHQDKIVGIDWLSATGDDEPFMGLKFRMRPGACFALDLDEHSFYRGKGVGLALLAFSLNETRRRGFHTQVAIISTRNVKMTSAAPVFFGFKKIGRISTMHFFRMPWSVWHVGTRSGHREILLP